MSETSISNPISREDSINLDGVASNLSSTNDSMTTNEQTSTFSNITEFETVNSTSMTFNTDITSTLSSSGLSEIDKSRNATKELILKKQLLHDIQKLKIDLSQKDLMMSTMKADLLNRVSDLEDKLSDTVHAKQLMQAKYESRIRMAQSINNEQLNSLKSNLQESLKLQKKYKEQYTDLSKRSFDFKTQFVGTELNEDEYLELKEKSEEQQTIQDFIAVSYLFLLFPCLRMCVCVLL